MSATVGERYEPYHKSRNGELTTLLTYEHNNAMYTVILEQSNDPAVYNLVYLNTNNQSRSVVGRITDLPTYKQDYTGMQIPENQRDNSLKSGIRKIIKSPCSRYIIIQMSQSHLMHCYSLSPVFEPGFEVFAFKLFEYKPDNTHVLYQFTPSGNFIYCMHKTTLHKLDTLTGREVYKGQVGDTNFNQLIPLNDTMICGQYMKGYNRKTGDNNPAWTLTTERKLYFKLGRVLASGIEWLDTLEVLADDLWLLPVTYGQVFKDYTKITCILDRNTLYITYESRISWSVLALPIDMLANKFGQGSIVYQLPATDRDTLCPVLKYVHMNKLYGIVMNDKNFQIVSLRLDSPVNEINNLEVLAAGHHFNLPHKEKWDHSQPTCEIPYIDETVIVNKPDSLITKITKAIINVALGGPNTADSQDEDPNEYDIIEAGGSTNEYLDRSHDSKQSKSKITDIDFTPDLTSVLVCYSDGVYVYKAKLTYREVDELVTNMDTRFADLGIDMPAEILTDIACTVAIPEARLSVRDRHKVHDAVALEAKLAERMRALNNDPEIKIEKQSNDAFMKPMSVRNENIPFIGKMKYSANPGATLADYFIK
jgi:hypothetical protein